MKENYDFLFLLIVGEYKNSKVEEYFTNNFKNIFRAKDIDETIKIINNNQIDIILFNNSIQNSFNIIEEIKDSNEKTLTFFSANYLNTDELLSGIDIKLDGYLLESNTEADLEKLINKPISKYNIKKSNEIFGQYFNIANESIVVSKTDDKGIVTFVSDRFCEIHGYSREELIGKSHNIVKHPDNKPELFRDMWNKIGIEKKSWEGTIKNISKNGEAIYFKTAITPIFDINNNVIEYIAFRINISDILSDKKMLLDEIENNDLSILALIQIEDYKMLEKFYNDTLINKIEKEFADSLLSYMPKINIFKRVYSLGYGKFALLGNFYSYININKNINTLFEDFVKKVNDSVMIIDDFEYDLNILLSFSFGKHLLYEDAKQGLDEAILANKNTYSSNDASLRGQKFAKKNMEVVKMVKIALDNFNIVSYFQPIINNKTKEIEKYESLVRLIDENNNVLTPFDFLQVAKDSGYYNKITNRVLKNSFKILKRINTDISINISALDIEREETRNMLFYLLEENKSHAHKIVFELLEDERVKDFSIIKKFIRKVKKLGVKIAIDDFGSGYSSFERLLEFDPDIIKIDGSLVKNIECDVFSRNIIETIAIFAKKQKMKTVAEFVENENIFNILNDMGIDYSQGYYFGKPEEMILQE